MVVDEKPKSIMPVFIITVLITCAIKVILDLIMTFILSIPFGENVPALAFAIYLIPSTALLGALSIWFLHIRLHTGTLKFGLLIVLLIAIIIESLIVPFTYDLPGEDLAIMLNWGLSFLVLIIAVALGLIAYRKFSEA